MMMSEISSVAMESFWNAEVDYRLERARRSYGRRPAGRRLRLRLRRRPTLALPGQRRRPVAVA